MECSLIWRLIRGIKGALGDAVGVVGMEGLSWGVEGLSRGVVGLVLWRKWWFMGLMLLWEREHQTAFYKHVSFLLTFPSASRTL